ncbi:UNVERIFIED_CONTAM: putative ribonuclease H protein [Sesamum latifolium]|uniref:Ribonuclease H protein n=1 Tax=Sesamum latifolium TaxID=2727402 RepID=A0AAW2WDG4_9LAMI
MRNCAESHPLRRSEKQLLEWRPLKARALIGSHQVFSSSIGILLAIRNVLARQKETILNILQMPECNHHAKHLGLPFCKPTSRTEVFSELVDKLTKKLSLWKAKNLSRAGKLTLIKNVAQSIPVYQMSTFLLPKKICKKMDAIVRRFWWQNQHKEQNQRFLALKSWKDICQPKHKGGLGIRCFSDFNEALLSKISWDIFTKADSPRFLMGVAEHRQMQQNYSTWGVFPGHNSVGSEHLGGPVDPLATKFQTTTAIELEAKLANIGKFSAKSAFREIQLSKSTQNQEDETVGKRIWSLDLHNRLKIFIWRLLFDVLPTKGKLGQFLQIPNTECSLCDWQVENAHHLFLCCPFAERIWILSKWQVRLHLLSHLTLREWFLAISNPNSSSFPDQSTQKEFITTWAITLERIWKARNDKVHGNDQQTLEAIAAGILKSSNEYWKVRNARLVQTKTNEEWSPPPTGWLKANTDITLKEEKCFAGIIVRDHESKLIRAITKEMFARNASTAELRAIKLAVETLHKDNVENVIFETDSLEATQWISGKIEEADHAAQFDVKMIKDVWAIRPNLIFRKIPRLCNGMAHGLAK